jgi:hypothetical protein
LRIALVPLGFAAGAILARLLLNYASPDFAVDRAQPLVVVTYWQQSGALMWLALFVAIAIASIGYVRFLSSFDRLRMTLSLTTMCSALACAAALAFPVVFSSDAYAYAGYGFIASHGIDPYAHAQIGLRNPLMDAVLWQWGNPPPVCVYGPAFVWFAQAIVAVFGALGAAAPLWAFRIAACIALVACVPLAYAAFARFPARARFAAAAGIALNPIAIWSCAEGHNDVYVLALALGGFALAQRARPFSGALLLALSPLVKAPGLIAAAILTIASWRDRPRLASIAAGTIAGLTVSAIVAWPLESGLRAHLLPAGHYFPQFSLQYALVSLLPEPAAIGAAIVCIVFLAAAGIRKLLSGNLEGAPLLALAAWIAIPNPYPWYALWILPIAFLAWETPAAWAIVALTLCTVARYYPDATGDLSQTAGLVIVFLQLALPAAVLIACSTRSRWDRRGSRTPVPDLAISRFP